MRYLPIAGLLTLTILLGACASGVVSPASSQQTAQNVSMSLTPDLPRETVLLVSLDDGTIISQTISTSADVCFKKNSDSATTCLTRGEPVIDPMTNVVIGFEMIEDHIELVAKSH